MIYKATLAGYQKYFFIGLLLAVNTLCVIAQPTLPQRTLTVNPVQAIHFGTICLTGQSGGTATIAYDGAWSSTGSLLLLSALPSPQPAIFELKLCPGRSINITYTPTIYLTGSNGGSLAFDIGPTEKGGNGSTFVTEGDCDFITLLRVGGTLHVDGNAIPGTYTGTFEMTFNQE